MAKKNTYFSIINTTGGAKLIANIANRIKLNIFIDLASNSDEIRYIWGIDLLRELSQYVRTILWPIAGNHCIFISWANVRHFHPIYLIRSLPADNGSGNRDTGENENSSLLGTFLNVPFFKKIQTFSHLMAHKVRQSLFPIRISFPFPWRRRRRPAQWCIKWEKTTSLRMLTPSRLKKIGD
jgi:hypothetical protein